HRVDLMLRLEIKSLCALIVLLRPHVHNDSMDFDHDPKQNEFDQSVADKILIHDFDQNVEWKILLNDEAISFKNSITQVDEPYQAPGLSQGCHLCPCETL
ncbi:hypothetical protein Tco_1222155, partial [Tanacetum coccineum]